MPKFFTVNMFARLFHRHPRTIYRWLAEGFIKGKKVKGGWLIPHEEVERIMLEADPEDKYRMTEEDKP